MCLIKLGEYRYGELREQELQTGVTKAGAYYTLGNHGRHGLQICFVWWEGYYCDNASNFENVNSIAS